MKGFNIIISLHSLNYIHFMLSSFYYFMIYRFLTTISSLKQWKNNEYVTTAAFEYLVALYFRNVKHDFFGIIIIIIKIVMTIIFCVN